MTVTTDFIRKKYSEFNALIFNSSLPEIAIVLSKSRTFVGRLEYSRRRKLFGFVSEAKDIRMRISTLFDLSERELEDVIIHEMIHCHIAVNGIADTSTHGKVFRKMMNDINTSYARNISISHRSASAPAARTAAVRTNILCVTLLKGGLWGVTSCASTRVMQLKKTLPRYYCIDKMEWYSSDDPYFNRFPRARTPRIYKISREDLDIHLKNAKRIIFA